MNHALVLLCFIACACDTPAQAPPKEARAGDRSSPEEIQEGLALMERYECARCHSGAGVANTTKNCTGCHQSILGGEFNAEAEVLARWQELLSSSDNALIDTLDLRRAEHFQREWITAFLRSPYDLRPALGPTMPRLRLSAEEASAIAHALVPVEEFELIDGDSDRGEALVRQGRCGQCHLRGGETLPGHESRNDNTSAVRRAPDLLVVARWQSTHLLRWLMDPREMDHDTLMPQTGYSLQNARDVAAFLMPPPVVAFSRFESEEELGRLPLLERDVFHDEVEARVFRRLCWHCHGDPDYARNEGGPGNTGGFGFAPRRLDLSSYEGVMSGAVNDEGERYSVVFGEGTPRLIEVLLHRHLETQDSPEFREVRGMPLGMPPLPMEDIQLVETWIAQGARR